MNKSIHTCAVEASQKLERVFNNIIKNHCLDISMERELSFLEKVSPIMVRVDNYLTELITVMAGNRLFGWIGVERNLYPVSKRHYNIKHSPVLPSACLNRDLQVYNGVVYYDPTMPDKCEHVVKVSYTEAEIKVFYNTECTVYKYDAIAEVFEHITTCVIKGAYRHVLWQILPYNNRVKDLFKDLENDGPYLTLVDAVFKHMEEMPSDGACVDSAKVVTDSGEEVAYRNDSTFVPDSYFLTIGELKASFTIQMERTESTENPIVITPVINIDDIKKIDGSDVTKADVDFIKAAVNNRGKVLINSILTSKFR